MVEFDNAKVGEKPLDMRADHRILLTPKLEPVDLGRLLIQRQRHDQRSPKVKIALFVSAMWVLQCGFCNVSDLEQSRTFRLSTE